ncbi:nicotinamide riboside transporter PnuC [Thiomicrospira sp. ALE5]|uniref:nicotinamide riboside transporter PnuC n=1 Tax=Thiomicrospira sp. ALE5 TaxID=748650 RepID=UPI0008E61B20|nr:nicotinamide riboside transporter PnuC [Thiomicrospira sp. ALE5]SFR60470.1 nicotinamide mononucleotide transporter [Thiomicrospira sp. ALE5]
MDGQLAELFNLQLQHFSIWEAIAVALGLAYVLMAAKEIVWAWPAAFVSTAIYMIIFWEGNLPMQSALNLFYMGMAAYGWWLWQVQPSREAAANNTDVQPLAIHTWGMGRHALWIGLGILLTFSFGGLLTLFEASQMPYLDAGVMVFSMMTTFLMARKVLESWFYWIVINTFAVALYWQTGYPLTAMMFVAYMGLAWYGMIKWQLRFRAQTNTATAA